MNNSTLSNFSKGGLPTRDKSTPVEFQVVAGIIGVVTILANGALLFVMFKQKHMLQKPYNVIILNLAVVDVLTGTYINCIFLLNCFNSVYVRVVYSFESS